MKDLEAARIMLNLEQDAPIAEAIGRLSALQMAKSVLLQVEWSSGGSADGEGRPRCPLCDQTIGRGHSPDCQVGMVLTTIDAVLPREQES